MRDYNEYSFFFIIKLGKDAQLHDQIHLSSESDNRITKILPRD